MVIDLAKNKAEFEGLARQYIKRDGVEKVLAWLDSTDFYSAPASTKYHLSVEGGLCQHSLNVFHRMTDLANHFYGLAPSPDNVYGGATLDEDGTFSMENIAIVALFHDICKANCYVKDFKNVEVDGKWEQQEYWRWEEQFVYGHGTKSVYMLQQFMRLFIDEAQAIRYHMSGHEDPLTDHCERGYAEVFDKSKFAALLAISDSVSTWFDETID